MYGHLREVFLGFSLFGPIFRLPGARGAENLLKPVYSQLNCYNSDGYRFVSILVNHGLLQL